MNRVKEHLQILSLKQCEFAAYLGIHPITFNGYVSEHRTPNVDVAWRIVVGIQKQYKQKGKVCRFEDVFPAHSYTKPKKAA